MEGGEEEEEVVFTQSRGIRSTRNTHNTDPFKPQTDGNLALCHPYLQLRYSVHPHRPACAQQHGENFPIGADPSGSILALS